MCGITGFLDLSQSRSRDDMLRIARDMGDRIRHRGPDEGREWVDAEGGLAFAHRRLSIIDLSAGGRQPMLSKSGRYVLSYNGEIYNFRDLRTQLEATGSVFTSQSDTEVLLEGLCQWGIEKTLTRVVGMFALALWDRKERTLALARDRLGIKPLYWGRQGNHIFFGSELKSFFPHPDFTAAVNRAALSDLVSFNYIPGPDSIYADVSHLGPGCVARIDAQGNIHFAKYWDVTEVARQGTENQLDISDAEAETRLDELLCAAVRDRMISDVSLGTLLSGGVDSSTVTALMQSASDVPVKTFSVGFTNQEFNETGHARSIAEHLGTEHNELILSDQDALDVVPKLSHMFCEPFADSSQIPTYLVSVMARRHVTVALSGDGGDEAFGGYNRYLAGATLWPRISGIPTPVRRMIADITTRIPDASYDQLAQFLPKGRRPSQLGDKISKVSGMLECNNLDEFYNRVVRFWNSAESVVIGGVDGRSQEMLRSGVSNLQGPIERMQLKDMLTYLPGDILAKVDRASMATSLEARVPLLDHRVIEFAWSLPMNMKIRDGQTKWLLRRVLERYVPKDLFERPKAGFAVPLGDWLRGPLRDWAEDLLSEEALNRSGLFHAIPVRAKWQRHLAGQHHEHYALWSILMAQDWHRTWMA